MVLAAIYGDDFEGHFERQYSCTNFVEVSHNEWRIRVIPDIDDGEPRTESPEKCLAS